MIDLPPFDALAFSLHHSPGVHAILVGSGLSRAAGIPTGWEITLNLIGRLAALDRVTEQDDWAKWYRDKYGKEPSYSEILDTLASTQAERRAILEGFITSAGGGEPRKPTKAHHAIAQLVASGAVRVVITTNFDRLIEAALRDAGVEPTVIAGDDAIKGATPLVHAKCTVIKVHGDYLDTRIKNTDTELADYSPAMNALLDQVFDNFGLLAVGWSGEWDAALRSAIQRAPSRRYPFYWAARGCVGTLAQDLINQRGGRSTSISDADSFFVKLGETLEALKQASRPHPHSVEMAIALAGRYCRDDKFAMEWAEFLHREVEKIRAYVSGPDYPCNPLTKASFNAAVELFLSKTEIIRRSCLICGRWGTVEANKSVVRAMQSVSFAAEFPHGIASNISLREFGASLIFYWNLAGIVEEKRWTLAHELIKTEIKKLDKKFPAVALLPPTKYYDTDWSLLNNSDESRTPVSDLLFQFFTKEAMADIFLIQRQAEELFNRVELLVSLEAAVVYLRNAVEPGRLREVPIGRYQWNRGHKVWQEAIDEYEALPETSPIYVAGLLGGSKDEAALVFREMREYLQRVSRTYY